LSRASGGVPVATVIPQPSRRSSQQASSPRLLRRDIEKSIEKAVQPEETRSQQNSGSKGLEATVNAAFAGWRPDVLAHNRARGTTPLSSIRPYH
jgi:hypothetical protein